MKNIAVFGGTFNPVHIGHIEMVKAVDTLDFIDEILIIPDKIPPHKSPEFLASEEHRIEMCNIAFKDIKKAKIDTREILRGGKSYTFDTICELKKEYENANIFLVCGGDMAVTLDTWYRFYELTELCEFLVFSRHGVSENEFNKTIETLKEKGAKITVINKKITDVSSTLLREKLKLSGETVGLLTKDIYDFIKANKVYG